MRLKQLFIGVLAFVSISFLHAQPKYSFGPGAGYGMNYHRTTMSIYPSSRECGSFDRGEGNGMYFGVAGRVPILPSVFATGRVQYQNLSGSFTARCTDNIIVQIPGTNEFAPLVRESRYDASLHYALLDFGLRWIPLDVPFFIEASVGSGLPLFTSEYTEDEEILSPDGVLYENNLRTRPIASGEIKNTIPRLDVIAHLGYEFSLNERTLIVPELSYRHPFANVATGDAWKIQNVSFGVSVLFGFGMDEPPEPPPPPRIEPKPEPLPPIASIKTSSDASIHILETIVTETFPLLPYIFFDQNSAQLLDRYHAAQESETANYAEQNLPRKTLDIYHNILDIFGKRMRDNPAIRIALIGSTDGKHEASMDSSLASQRAGAMKEYLARVWRIAEDRMEIRTSTLPQIPTSQMYAEGDEENRRVEILSESDELFKPVVHERFSEYSFTPPTIMFELGAQGEKQIARWELTARRNEETFVHQSGIGNPPGTLQWTISDSLARVVNERDSIRCSLRVTDQDGRSSSSEMAVPVYKSRNSFEVGRLSLIVFDFDKSDISTQNQSMIERFVAKSIQPRSNVLITGSTDRLGEAEHNMELSTARATAVRDVLLRQKPILNYLESKGIGEAPDLYDNNIPEGRYYCRTVSVNVTTPVGE